MEYRRNPREEEIRRRRRKKQQIRSLVMLIQSVLIVVLAMALIVVSVKYSNLKKGTDSLNNESVASGSSSELTDEQKAMIAETEQWYLMLVNPDISVSNDFINSVDKTEISSSYTSGHESSKYLDSRIVDKFEEMCKAADEDGLKIWACSAYRTYAYQQSLYNNRVKRFENEGLSEDTAKIEAAKIVALPGTSEHHLGLAVDINSVEESFENSAEFEWLQQNAADFGFIMRYSKDKQDITKIIYEPWHYRYVGVEHAKAINQLGMCLEEYIDYLKSGGTVN